MSILDTFNKNFSLPDMGDFYYDAPDQATFLSIIYDALNPLRRTNKDSIGAYLYYEQEPPTPGYDEANEQYTFALASAGSKISETGDMQMIGKIKVIDGDTIVFSSNDVNNTDDKSKAKLKELTFGDSETGNGGDITVRFANIDCAELPHFECCGPISMYGDFEKTTVDIKKAISNSTEYLVSRYRSFMDEPEKINEAYDGATVNENNIFFNYSREQEKSFKVIKMGDDIYHQYFERDGNIYILFKSDVNSYSKNQIADAGIARDVVANGISRATEVRVVVNNTKITQSANRYNLSTINAKLQKIFGAGLLEALVKDNAISIENPGRNYWGQDAYGRAIAAIFVRIDGRWINLNKMVIANTNETQMNPYEDHTNGNGVFDPNSYNYDAKAYADAVYNTSKTMDDRAEVQNEIFSALNNPQSADALKDWTVTIGDVTLFVPPTSIRSLSQTKAERMPIVRARGSLVKGATKVQDIIEMDIYFNEDHGINGYEYKTKTRKDKDGKDITYWMNGLRALYAQFLVAPFLPIDNKYINEVLGISAVSMISFSCDTVPGFPKLIKATLQMSKFEYQIYMPEIPIDDDDNGSYRNYFAKQINWPLFRYFYQRLLRNGEELKEVKFLDEKFVKNTFGNKTCLIPARFLDPYIKFYTPNKAHLDKLKAAKIERLNKSSQLAQLSKKEIDCAKELAGIKNELNYINNLDASENPIAQLNDFVANDLATTDIITVDYNIRDGWQDEGILNTAIYNGSKLAIREKDETGKYVVNVKKTEVLNKKIASVADMYASNIMEVKGTDGRNLCENYNVDSSVTIGTDLIGWRYHIKFKLNLDYMSKEELDTLRAQATANGKYEQDDILKDNTVDIPILINMSKTAIKGVGGYATSAGFDTTYFEIPNEKDINFLGFLEQVADASSNKGEQDIARLKGSIDYVDTSTIKFELYNSSKEFLVEAIHINTSNTFSQITLQNTTGYAPQYMGGSDISITLSLSTRSDEAAAAMKRLSEIAADYAREYRIVLSSWPLKIETELTKLFGITDVLIEAVEVDTVPNFPGLYKVTMNLISVDRSLRNREAMHKKDLNNFHNLSINGVAYERSWRYDQMAEFMSEAELYPDLQLPTLKELSENGFNFIQYSNKRRVYPDPDFYFTYSHVLVSQIIRETVLNSLDSDMADMSVTDSLGKKMSGSIAYACANWNKNFEEKNIKITIDEAFRIVNQEDLAPARFLMDFEGALDKNRDEIWAIATNVKVAFMERRLLNHISDNLKLQLAIDHEATLKDIQTYNNSDNSELEKQKQVAETDEKEVDDAKNSEIEADKTYYSKLVEKSDKLKEDLCGQIKTVLEAPITLSQDFIFD